MLIPKARVALTRYGHQVVIGNDLHKRKHEVVLVEKDDSNTKVTEQSADVTSVSGGFKEKWLRLSDLEKEKREQGMGEEGIKQLEIEELIIEELVKRHEAWIAA